jgi:hypothetical protein
VEPYLAAVAYALQEPGGLELPAVVCRGADADVQSAGKIADGRSARDMAQDPRPDEAEYQTSPSVPVACCALRTTDLSVRLSGLTWVDPCGTPGS